MSTISKTTVFERIITVTNKSRNKKNMANPVKNQKMLIVFLDIRLVYHKFATKKYYLATMKHQLRNFLNTNEQ